MKEYRGRILGYCFVNPGYPREAREEVRRCLDAGMIGVKLYNAYFLDDPVHFPIVELTIELGVPILMHAGVSYNADLVREQPHLSGPRHFVNLVRRYPEAILIEAHIGGGGDWENVIEGLRAERRVYADTSGSVVDETLLDTAVRELGPDRLLYGNDGSFCDGLGKILSADLSPGDRERIFSGNFLGILRRRKGGPVL
jgi:predicted TIM-barrel fold metal-dependent hydrolase